MSNQTYSGRIGEANRQYTPLQQCRDVFKLIKNQPAAAGIPAYGTASLFMNKSGRGLIFNRLNEHDCVEASSKWNYSLHQSLQSRPYWILSGRTGDDNGTSLLYSIVDNTIAVNALIPIRTESGIDTKWPIRVFARVTNSDGTIVGNYGLTSNGTGNGGLVANPLAQGIVGFQLEPWAFSVSCVVRVNAGQKIGIYCMALPTSQVTYMDDPNLVVDQPIGFECFVEFAKI